MEGGHRTLLRDCLLFFGVPLGHVYKGGRERGRWPGGGHQEGRVCPRTDRKWKRYDNAVDVVVRLHDPTDLSTERTTPPRSAHVQLGDVPRTLDTVEAEGEFCQHDALVTVMMKLRRRASPKHYDDMTEVCNCGGGHRTRLNSVNLCVLGCPLPPYIKEQGGRPAGPWTRQGGEESSS